MIYHRYKSPMRRFMLDWRGLKNALRYRPKK